MSTTNQAKNNIISGFSISSVESDINNKVLGPLSKRLLSMESYGKLDYGLSLGSEKEEKKQDKEILKTLDNIESISVNEFNEELINFCNQSDFKIF